MNLVLPEDTVPDEEPVVVVLFRLLFLLFVLLLVFLLIGERLTLKQELDL